MISWSIAGAIFAVIGIPLVILVFDLWTRAAEKGKKQPEPDKKSKSAEEKKPEAETETELESDSKSAEEKSGGAAS